MNETTTREANEMQQTTALDVIAPRIRQAQARECLNCGKPVGVERMTCGGCN